MIIWRCLNSGLPDCRNEAPGSVPTLPPHSHVVLKTLLHLSIPEFSHVQNEDNDVYLNELLWELREIISIKCLEKGTEPHRMVAMVNQYMFYYYFVI